MKDLKTFLNDLQPVGIVVGLPIAPDGSEDERAAAARDLGSTLVAKTQLPVQELGGRVRGRKEEVDSLAATVLLQAFLDSRRQ
jgi:RNase H-fold protein (predicted Holliday junction resolvase)